MKHESFFVYRVAYLTVPEREELEDYYAAREDAEHAAKTMKACPTMYADVCMTPIYVFKMGIHAAAYR